jgi:glycosyltransferase involved in cell wall biosynthesis
MYHSLMLLTIAIPSFNRPEAALETLKNLLDHRLPDEIQVVIANNGSTNSDYLAVADYLDKKSNATFLNFKDNLGFASNFIRLLQNCSSKYVLTMSDEDDVDILKLPELLENLSFLSPNLYILRNQSTRYFKVRKLKAGSLKGASNYMSGMIFNLDSVGLYLPEIQSLVSEEEFGKLYPQVLIALILFTLGDSFTSSTPGISFRAQLPSTIRSSNGNPYWHPTERVYQYLSLNRCIDHLDSSFFGGNNGRLKSFRMANKRKFFGLLFDAVETIEPKIMMDLTRSSFSTALNAELRLILRRCRALLR